MSMSFTIRKFLKNNVKSLAVNCSAKRQIQPSRFVSTLPRKPTFQSNHTMRLNKPRFYASSTNREEIRAKAAVGPFTFKAAAVFLGVGTGLLLYFQSEKKRVEKLRKEKEAEKSKTQSFGKPKLGGDYVLTNAETGKPFGSEDLKGRFSLIYFGFTHCPDICPEELDKMAEVVDITKKDIGDNILVPVFITCDPRRDTKEIVKEYVKDFHKDLIGLTDTEDNIRAVAKLFRVYVSSPPDISEGDDYLVDHSIFFYLMDPEGKFLDCYSQNSEAEGVAESFKSYYKAYIESGGKLKA
ncbi:MAG: SCO1/SenC-domain-containing protein [Benjaminiella poitrasii]|nr:MAG: SCO1/SenC-domain-containing protein [Benjaminiella poitrasii]